MGQKFCRKITLVNFYFMKKMVSKSTHINYITWYCSICVTYEPIFPILCFAFFVKKIRKYDPHFWAGENFLKFAGNSLLRYPVGRKFRRNRSISND